MYTFDVQAPKWVGINAEMTPIALNTRNYLLNQLLLSELNENNALSLSVGINEDVFVLILSPLHLCFNFL